MSIPVRWSLIFLLLLPLLALATSGCASLSPEFSYQGRLLDDSGSPVPNGSYEMTYSIFHTAAGGTALYSQTQAIAVENGLFTTAVGPSANLDPQIFAQPAWMEITVEGETLAPRQRLQGSPFAFSLAPGAVVQGIISRDRDFEGYEDTGAALTVWNRSDLETGGHGLLVVNQAAPLGEARDRTAALQAIAAGGDSRTDSGAYAAVLRSDYYVGMYARGGSKPFLDYFAGVFDSGAGISLIGGGSCVGCTLAYMGQNAGEAAIAAGDFVTVSGVELDTDLNVPLLQVMKARAGDTAVIGVAGGAAAREPVSAPYGAQVGGFKEVGGTAAAGDFLAVVVQGLVQADVGQGVGLELGQQLDGVAAAQPSTGRLMSEPQNDDMAWVMLSGQ